MIIFEDKIYLRFSVGNSFVQTPKVDRSSFVSHRQPLKLRVFEDKWNEDIQFSEMLKEKMIQLQPCWADPTRCGETRCWCQASPTLQVESHSSRASGNSLGNSPLRNCRIGIFSASRQSPETLSFERTQLLQNGYLWNHVLPIKSYPIDVINVQIIGFSHRGSDHYWSLTSSKKPIFLQERAHKTQTVFHRKRVAC